MSNILRAIGDDMAAIFGRHPDAARLEYRSNPAGDTAADHHRPECESCGELFDGDGAECERCVEEGRAGYRREHDHGAER